MRCVRPLSARGVYHFSLGRNLLLCAAHKVHPGMERVVLLRNSRCHSGSLVKMWVIFWPVESVSRRGSLKESAHVLLSLSSFHCRCCLLARLSLCYLVLNMLLRVLCRSQSLQRSIQGALIFNDCRIKSGDMLYFIFLTKMHVLIFIHWLAVLVERRILVGLAIFVRLIS